jgi:DNA primase
VRELVARRVPLYRFVLTNVVAKYDLDRADGRVDALRESARLVSSIRDRSKVDAFARELASMVGVDVEEARAEVRRASTRRPAVQSRPGAPAVEETVPVRPRQELPDLRDPRFAIERETLKLVLQHPMVIGRTTAEVGPEDFMHPTYRAVWETITAGGGPVAGAGDASWSGRLRDVAPDPAVASAITELSVEQLPTVGAPTADYVAQHVVRLLELTALRRIEQVKSKMQRTNPVENDEAYRRMFGELAALEEHRRKLRDRIVGTQ